MAVSVEKAGDALRLGTPERLFSAADTDRIYLGSGFRGYDVLPDGSGFVLMQDAGGGDLRDRPRLVYAENWHEAYRKGDR